MSPVQTSTPTRVCPQCNHSCDAEAIECPRCQIVFAKIGAAAERREATRDEGLKLGTAPALEQLAAADCLLIRQKVNRMEALTDIEEANQYTVLDALGHELFDVREESGGIARQFLESHRPFTMHIATGAGEPVLRVERPFRWLFHEVNVHDATGRLLGVVRKRFSILGRHYTQFDSVHGREYEIHGPLLKPWTFEIKREGRECGAIRKQWAGALREMFTDADVFGVEFPRDLAIETKALFLGAVFLIDFLHFESDDD